MALCARTVFLPWWSPPELLAIVCLVITCSAIAQDGLGSYGNMETSTPHSSKTSQVITMKLCKFDNVHETNTCAKFG